jgi:hypothetical protein
MKINLYILFILIFGTNLFFTKNNASENTKEPLKVYYDGGGSFFNYLRTEINFVSFVRNPIEADVHLQVNSQQSANRGKEYRLFFTGQRKFDGINDTLVTSILGSVTDKERDDQLLRLVKLGLIFYLSKTPYNKFINLNVEDDYELEPTVDNWDGWVFSIGLNSSLEAEESKKEFVWEANLDVDRIKDGSKIKIDGNFSNEVQEFEQSEGITTSHKRERNLGFLYVNSLSEHFSAGFFINADSKTYENIKLGLYFAPALEYSIYPYNESIRRKLTFLYRIGFLYNDYFEETIYFKSEEELNSHSLKIDYELNEIWGEADFYVQVSNYLHDLNKNRIEFSSRLSFRLSGAFFFDVRATTSYINDQVYLPKEKLSFEEVLLNQKKLSTQYEYELKFGVRYTFGSLYNNIVNTRF